MPFVGVIADLVVLVGLGGGAVGGSIASWCSRHPGPGCVNKRGLPSIPAVEYLTNERSELGPCNVPMYNIIQCRDQVKAATVRVTSSSPEGGVAQFDNIPPACMNLASVLGGSCNGDGARPTPCGSACLKYTGLSDDQLRSLSNSLNAK